jgi:hypothetical protein
MLLFPPFHILRGRAWGQCTNQTDEYLVVYGPKHDLERSIFDTSPYVLPPVRRRRTAGIVRASFFRPTESFMGGGVPEADRWLLNSGISDTSGPRAWMPTATAALGIMAFWPSQINWAIPNFSYQDIVARLRSLGRVATSWK